MNKKVLLVVANPSIHPTLQFPIGFWASELFHPIEEFNDTGISWTICSPNGGKVMMDPLSDPNDDSQYSAWDEVSKKYLDDSHYLELLDDTPSISSLNLDEFDAIMVAGGQSPMYTFETAIDLHQAFIHFYQQGKVAAALCHGTALLNFLKTDPGEFLVNGKMVTGFSNEEEEAANSTLNTEIMPWRIEDELTKIGANFKKAEAWTPYVVVDENLITGQQNMSGKETAIKIISQLGS